MNWERIATVARTDLKQLIQARDFWLPMMILGGLFFFVIPTILLLSLSTVGDIEAVGQISQALEVLPQKAQESIQGDTESGRASYALAVYLFAPVAVVVPLTISTAVGAATIVGEREKGTGEFLAHSPANVKDIYLGKLIASLLPGYATTLVGFGVYSLVVNLIVGPEVGGWFFPTQEWWVLMLWVVAAVPGPDPVDRAAPVGPGEVDRRRPAGIGPGHPPAHLGGVQPVDGRPVRRRRRRSCGSASPPPPPGPASGLAAIFGLSRGVRAVTRTRLLGVADGI